MKKNIENLGIPNLVIDNFRLWLHRREFPNSNSYNDANWLIASVYCSNKTSKVWIKDEPFIFTPCIKDFIEMLQALLTGKLKTAHLDMIEPNLAFNFKIKTPNCIQIKIIITPDTTKEGYEYNFDTDNDATNKLIADLYKILDDYPIKGKRNRHVGN